MNFNGFVVPVLCIPGFGFFSFLIFLFCVLGKKKRASVFATLLGSGHIYKKPSGFQVPYSVVIQFPLLSRGAYPYSHRFSPYIQKAVSRITGFLYCVISLFISASTAHGSFHRKTGSLSLFGGSGLYTANGGLFHRPTKPFLLKTA